MGDGDTIRGRAAIAAALGRHPKTITRWYGDGILRARKAGPYDNSPLVVRRADVEKLLRRFGESED